MQKKTENTELYVLVLIKRVCIWKWMDEAESPLWCTELKAKHGFQVSQ